VPFVHVERELWDLRDGLGQEIGVDAPEWLNPERQGSLVSQ
jgi:hypothetical protein